MRAAVLHGPGELRVEEVLEAVGRPEAWRAAVQAARPGGTAVLGGDCSAGSDVALRAAPLHHAELDVRGGFHHAPAEVDRALELLATGAVDWRAPAGEARKPVVDPMAVTPRGGAAGPRPRRWRIRPAAALAAVALGGAAAPAAAAACQAPTAVTHPAARPATPSALDAALAGLATRAPGRVQLSLAGRSVEGRPIRVAEVSAGPRGIPARDRAVVVAGASIHGNERSGGDALLAVLRDLTAPGGCLARAVLDAGVDVVLVPDQNPDGRARASRHNAAGFDLNRDLSALTQPETAARLAVLRRHPALAWLDLHEEPGVRAFVPPYSPPIHPRIGRFARESIAAALGPAVRSAWRARGWLVERRAYDLLFPGYGDAAATLLTGGAGMTIEVGSALSYAGRAARQAAAVEAVLRRVAGRRASLVAAWHAERARAARPEPGGPRGWVLPATDDARALAVRLQGAGARVEVLDAPASATVRPWTAGAAPAREDLPAGTLLLPRAQPAGAWLEALLGTDATGPGRDAGTTDVTAWSPALFAGLGGGGVTTDLGGHAATELTPAVPATAAPAYGADAHTLRGLGLAVDLLAHGHAVLRTADEIVVPGDVALAEVAAAAHRRGASVRALAAVPAGATPLRAPRVALLADPGGSTARPPGPMPTASTAWARWVLRERLGIDPVEVDAAGLGAGALAAGGVTALVVPDGATPAGGLDAAAFDAVGRFVDGGGTFLGWRRRGADVAAGAHLLPPPGASPVTTIRGAAIGVAPASGAPYPALADGAEPALDGPPVATWGGLAAGDATHLAALTGRPAAVGAADGAGRATVLAFDPAFRALTEAAERAVAEALLA